MVGQSAARQAGAGASRHDGHLVLVTELQNPPDLVFRFRQRHDHG